MNAGHRSTPLLRAVLILLPVLWIALAAPSLAGPEDLAAIIAERIESRDPEMRERGLMDLRHADSWHSDQRILRALARLLSDPDPGIARTARGLLLQKGLDLPLSELVVAARSRDEQVRHRALHVLKGSPEGRGELAELARDPVTRVRVTALEYLGSGDARERKEWRPVLLEALRDGTREEANHATLAIARHGLEAVPGLIDLLDHPAARVRWRALRALVACGVETPEAPDDVRIPRQLLSDPDPRVRLEAIEAVWRLEGDLPAVTSAIGKALRDSKARTRLWATFLPNQDSEVAAAVASDLAEALDDASARVRVGAMRALEDVSPWSEPVRGAVLEALEDRNRRLRNRAATELARREPGFTFFHLLPQDIPGWRGERTFVASGLIAASGPCLEDPELRPKVIPPLMRMLRSGDADLRWIAARCLEEGGPESAFAVQLLVEGLGDRDGWVRRQALRALVAIDEERFSTLAGLDRTLRRDDCPSPRASHPAYLAMSANPESPVPGLAELLDHPNHQVRCHAVWILMRLGRDSEQALSRLEDLTRSPNVRLRDLASAAVTEIRYGIRDHTYWRGYPGCHDIFGEPR